MTKYKKGMMWKRFGRSEDGTALVLVTITLPVLIGLALLVIDGARVYGLHTDLQKGADALAIAAAAELDGTSDAITRANHAIGTGLLVHNEGYFWDDAQPDIDASDVTALYLSCLPASDDTPIDPDPASNACVTSSPYAARYVEITVNPKSLTAIFPASYLGGPNSLNVSAKAVAGFGQSVCNFMPLYICNPYEGTAISLEDALADPSIRRRMIEMRQQGGASAQNFPGNYGFLQPQDSSGGANQIRDMIARVSPDACYFSDGVELQTGFLATVRSALNVRFDLYDEAMSSVKGDPDFRPSLNVRKGYDPGAGSGCQQVATSEPGYRELTRDTCFDDESGCPYGNGRIGDGNWDFETYWNTNHPDRFPPSDPDGVPYSNANPPSRYDIYRYEIDNGFVGDFSTAAVRPESGVPQCYTGGTLSDTPDRRLIYGAVLNCQALDADPYYGPITGGSAPPLPVEAFASLFITETVQTGPDQIIRAELVDIAGHRGRATMDDFARDIVQLYR